MPQEKFDDASFKKEIAQLKIRTTDSTTQSDKYHSYNFKASAYSRENDEQSSAISFPFDPNSATIEEWKKLGIREKTALTIQKYISKGGHFYKPEDLKKIWGIREADAVRLIPYVQIRSAENRYQRKDSFISRKTFLYPPKILSSVEINSADTAAFISLPGIGAAFARRICNFRQRLGGFYSVNQVAETFGLPDSTFQKIKTRLVLNNISITKLNINTQTIEQLKMHPYIRFNLAKAIVNYRELHGPFQNVAGVKNIMIITDSIYLKLSPYLTVN